MRPSRSCCVFSRLRRARRSRLRQLALNLERVAQLLGGDAHAVQPLGQVDAAGALDRGAQRARALRRLRRGLGHARRAAPRRGVGRGDVDQPLAQLLEPRRRDLVEHLAPALLPLVDHGLRGRGAMARGRRGALCLELGK